MNGFFTKINLKDFLTVATIIGGIITTVGAIYVTATLAPYKQDLAVMDTKVEAYEERIVGLEENSVSQGERAMVLDRLGKLEGKVDATKDEVSELKVLVKTNNNLINQLVK